MNTIGDRIIHIRKRLGLSQADFADQISVAHNTQLSRGAVGNWEHNKGIKRENLERIADTFGCSLDWLMAGKGEPFPNDQQHEVGSNSSLRSGKKLDRTLFQVAHDMARRFEQAQLGGLASFEDFTYLVEKYYDELLLRRSQHQNGSDKDH